MEKMFIGYNQYVESPDSNTFRSPSNNNIHITGRNISLNVAGDYASSDYQGSIVYEHNYYYNVLHFLNGWSTNISNPESITNARYAETHICTGALNLYLVNTPSSGSWTTISVGTPEFSVRVYSGTTYNVRFLVKHKSTSPGTSITTIANVCNLLYYSGYTSSSKALPARGIYGSYTKPIIGIYATSYNSGLYLVYMNGTTETTVNITSGTVSSTVVRYTA